MGRSEGEPSPDRTSHRAEAYVRSLGLTVLADDGTVVVYRTPDEGW